MVARLRRWWAVKWWELTRPIWERVLQETPVELHCDCGRLVFRGSLYDLYLIRLFTHHQLPFPPLDEHGRSILMTGRPPAVGLPDPIYPSGSVRPVRFKRGRFARVVWRPRGWWWQP